MSLECFESDLRSAVCDPISIEFTMMKLSFKDLRVWTKGIELVDIVYRITEGFPKNELYGLTSQSRRSAVSIPSNIAEGSQRTSDKEFGNYILIAKGSLAELHAQMIIANRRGWLNSSKEKDLFTIIDDLSKMLYSLRKKLNTERGARITER